MKNDKKTATPFPIIEETRRVIMLQAEATGPTLSSEDGLRLVRGALPMLGDYRLSIDGIGAYRFGCGSGSFTYNQLVQEISILSGEPTTVPVLRNKTRKSSVIQSPIVEQTDNFFICENKRAYSKEEYEESTLEKRSEFENLDEAYSYIYHKGNRIGRDLTTEGVLGVLKQTKFIIDLIEERE